MARKIYYNGQKNPNYSAENRYTSTICLEKTFCIYCGDLLKQINGKMDCNCDNKKTGEPLYDGYSGEPLTKKFEREKKDG